jgi:hypothetical protein
MIRSPLTGPDATWFQWDTVPPVAQRPCGNCGEAPPTITAMVVLSESDYVDADRVSALNSLLTSWHSLCAPCREVLIHAIGHESGIGGILDRMRERRTTRGID